MECRKKWIWMKFHRFPPKRRIEWIGSWRLSFVLSDWATFHRRWHLSVRRDINFRQSVRQTNKQTQGIICRYVVVVLPLMVKERISMPIRPTSGAATSRTSEANWSRSRYTCATDNNKQKIKKIEINENANHWATLLGKSKCKQIQVIRTPSIRVQLSSRQFGTVFQLILIWWSSCPFYCGCAVVFVLVKWMNDRNIG